MNMQPAKSSPITPNSNPQGSTSVSDKQPISTVAEQKTIDDFLAKNGNSTANEITDQIFHQRHPELNGAALPKNSPLANEWKEIKSRLVEPRMNESANAKESKTGMSAPQSDSADSSAAALDAKGFLDMGASMLRKSLQEAMDAGRSAKETVDWGVEGTIDAGKQMYRNLIGEKKVAIAPGTPPAETPALENSPSIGADLRTKSIAADITGVFETNKIGGDPSTVQNEDSGVISYGKHQCTLSSKEDSLEKVLDRYKEIAPKSEITTKLEGFMDQVRNKDKSLRNNQEFIRLLEEAGKDPLMSKAQDDVFEELYWNPAMEAAEKAGVRSTLGAALLYDTSIQSGPDNLNTILSNTQKRFEGTDHTEQEFLKAFAEERTSFILKAAEQKRAKGDEDTAGKLEVSAGRGRMDYWKRWIDSGNLELSGEVRIYKHTLQADA